VSYYLSDHLGSVVQQTTSSGAVNLVRQYDTNGVLLQGQSTNGFAFTGREWDAETGLYSYRARYYDPLQSRFMGSDPIGLEGGPNLYAYVNGNPVRFTDPFGLCAANDSARRPPDGPGDDAFRQMIRRAGQQASPMTQPETIVTVVAISAGRRHNWCWRPCGCAKCPCCHRWGVGHT